MASPKTDIASNPLINPPALPHGAPAFDQIKPEHFLPAMKWAAARARENLRAIVNNPAPPTFANTIEALEFATTDLDNISSIFSMLANIKSIKAIEDIKDQVNAISCSFEHQKAHSQDLFRRVEYLYKRRSNLKLTLEEKALLEQSYCEFTFEGARLSPKRKKEFKQINIALDRAATRFSQNLVKEAEAYKKIISDEALLDGIPERVKQKMREAAEKGGYPGMWLVQLTPDPIELFEFCKNRALRKEICEADASVASRGKRDNCPLVLEIVRLRHRKARLLGYKSYAHFMIDQCMADSPESVKRFLRKVIKDSYGYARDHIDRLKKFAFDKDGITDFSSYDLGYYNRWLKEETFNVDLEQVREYFPLDQVLEGLKRHIEKLFNIEMREISGVYPVPEQGVRTYEIYDKQTSQILSVVYADYFARGGEKTAGAYASPVRAGSVKSGIRTIPLILNAANFTPPSPGQPALLCFDDVKTVFHEFGHALHIMLSEVKYPSISGMCVAPDFVEFPSQIMENWLFEKEVLSGFARHYKTGAPMPAALMEKMLKAERYCEDIGRIRIADRSMLDLKWHSESAARFRSVDAVEDDVFSLVSLFNDKSREVVSPTFDHLFDDSDGYGGHYHSYLWSEVMDKDAFTRFKKEGLYNPVPARELRRTMYAPGQTRNHMDMYVEFMGRKPDPAAMKARPTFLPP